MSLSEEWKELSRNVSVIPVTALRRGVGADILMNLDPVIEEAHWDGLHMACVSLDEYVRRISNLLRSDKRSFELPIDYDKNAYAEAMEWLDSLEALTGEGFFIDLDH